MRSTGDHCWQEAGRVVPRLMELFYRRLDFAAWSILYIHTDESWASYFRSSVRKRGTGRNGIPVYGLVTRDRSYETTGISREGRWEKDRWRGGERHAKACWDYLHIAGMEMASLGRNLRECMPYSVACAQSDGDYEFFRRTRDLTASTPVFIRWQRNTGF